MRGPYRKRRIDQPPGFKNFKPTGIPRKLIKKLTITVDEYEALRLADYEQMEHQAASEKMAISRPTFTRLIEKARNKLARAIIEGRELVVEGGNIEFLNTRRRCRDCGDEQVGPSAEVIDDCPECGSDNLEDLAEKYIVQKEPLETSQMKGKHMQNHQGRAGGGGYQGRNKGGAFGPGGYCICAKCGEKVPHKQGIKCTAVKCPKCGHTMVREELLRNRS